LYEKLLFLAYLLIIAGVRLSPNTPFVAIRLRFWGCVCIDILSGVLPEPKRAVRARHERHVWHGHPAGA